MTCYRWNLQHWKNNQRELTWGSLAWRKCPRWPPGSTGGCGSLPLCGEKRSRAAQTRTWPAPYRYIANKLIHIKFICYLPYCTVDCRNTVNRYEFHFRKFGTYGNSKVMTKLSLPLILAATVKSFEYTVGALWEFLIEQRGEANICSYALFQCCGSASL